MLVGKMVKNHHGPAAVIGDKDYTKATVEFIYLILWEGVVHG